MSEFKVQEAVVKEQDDSSPNSKWDIGFDTVYMFFLVTPSGKEVCYRCHSTKAHQAYSNLNKINSILNGNSELCLELNYEQSWIAQLLALVLRVTFLPFAILGVELCAVVPILAPIGIFVGSSGNIDGNNTQGLR